MARYFSSQLNNTAFSHLYFSTQVGFSQPFFAYEIGPLCNMTRSCSFSQATGDLQVISAVEEGVKKYAPRSFNLGSLYKKGFDLMRNLFSAAVPFENFDEPSRRALQTLLDFIKNKEYNEECLARALKKEDKDLSEADIAAALSEHLLAKLSPGKSYFLDEHSKGEDDCKCKCGCTAKIEYHHSGFGNQHVWHGFLDVVFTAHGNVEEVETAAHAIKRPNLDVEDETSEDIDESEHTDELDSSPGINSVEVRRDLDDTIDNLVAAQAIIFSVTQRERHPDLDNFLIPFLTISASHVRIFMYDAENDILLRSQELSIFRQGEDTLIFDTVVILWMVLHYKYFCSGIDVEHLSVRLEKVKSGFLELAKDCMHHYKASESCCDSFPTVPKERKLIGRQADEWAPCVWPGYFVSDYVYVTD